MMLKKISSDAYLLGFSTLGFFGLAGCGDQIQERPNFIIILVDDLGSQDVGVYGQQYIETPNIDILAQQGMMWTNAYSSSPVCSPTRVALLTGKNPARVGFTGHITRTGQHRYPENSRIIPPDDLMDIPLDEVILPKALKPAGYKSVNIGKWHVGREGHWPTDLGFDENIGGWTHGMPPGFFYPYENPDSDWNRSIPTLKGGSPGEYLTDRETSEAIEFIKKNRNNPFLLYLPHYAVHTPLEAPQELIDKYIPIVAGTSIDPVYAAMVERVDFNLGRLLQTLDDLNLANNTVVVFTSDNGALREIDGRNVADLTPFREGKGHLYEGGLRVPLIIRWPGHIKPGLTNDNLTISEDIYATVVDIVGNPAIPGAPLDGRSLVKEFKNPVRNSGVDIHWYYPHYSPRGNMPGAAIRSGDYKLIEFYDPPVVELYNLVRDAGEKTDLSEKIPDIRDDLLQKLHLWLLEMSPVLHTVNPNYNE